MVTAALAASIKQTLPAATIDYLVFEGTEGVLSQNPFVRKVITVPRKVSNAAVLFSLFRSYDLAFAAYPSDRTLLAATIAGKKSIGLIYAGKDAWWKRALLSMHSFCDDSVHVVANILSLLAPLGIAPIPRLVVCFNADDEMFARTRLAGGPYVVLHPYSRGACKFWGADKWGGLAGLIQARLGLRTIFTVTPDMADRTFLEKIAAAAPTGIEWFSELFSLNQLGAAIKGSTAYVGIDTVVTHVAAATGVPTLALFGPTLTRYWGPWPNGCTEVSPFAVNKGIQRSGNVTVVQKDWPCVPCNRETCAISTQGMMECLEQLMPEEVFMQLERVIGARG